MATHFLSLGNAPFRAYLASAVILAGKQLFSNAYIAYCKIKSNHLHAPEDKAIFPTAVRPKTGFGNQHPSVKRAYAVVQNDLENLPLYHIAGLLYVITGGTSTWPFYAVAMARMGHTCIYTLGLPYARGLFFFGGLIPTVYLLWGTASKLVAHGL